jgi:hypothetical protein
VCSEFTARLLRHCKRDSGALKAGTIQVPGSYRRRPRELSHLELADEAGGWKPNGRSGGFRWDKFLLPANRPRGFISADSPTYLALYPANQPFGMSGTSLARSPNKRVKKFKKIVD